MSRQQNIHQDPGVRYRFWVVCYSVSICKILCSGSASESSPCWGKEADFIMKIRTCNCPLLRCVPSI